MHIAWLQILGIWKEWKERREREGGKEGERGKRKEGKEEEIATLRYREGIGKDKKNKVEIE